MIPSFFTLYDIENHYRLMYNKNIEIKGGCGK